MERDFYKILGVQKNSCQKEIKDAYRCEIKKCHPDASKTKKTEDRFREVQEAYEILGNEKSRKDYDSGLICGSRLFNGGPSFSNKSTFEDADSYFFRKQGENNNPFNNHVFSDFFDGFFSRNSVPFEEFDLNIILSRDEAMHGGSCPITIPLTKRCPHCAGFSFFYDKTCSSCGGNGKINCEEELMIRIPRGVKHGSRYRLFLDNYMDSFYLNVTFNIE